MAAATRELTVLVLVFTALNSVTSATFDSVKAASSKACQITVDSCKGQAISFDPSLTTDCKLMSATVNGVTASQCLVKNGFCTEIEFVKLKNAACSGSESEQQTVSPAKTALYTVLYSTSDTCTSKALACVQGSSVATVLKQNEKYCDLFQISNPQRTTKACLTASPGCSDDDFNSLNSTACTSPAVSGGPFATAVIASSSACKYNMELCTVSSVPALALIQSEQYCQVMTISNNGVTTNSCLVGSAKCTQSEFDQLKQAACSGTAVHVGWVALLTCLIYRFLN